MIPPITRFLSIFVRRMIEQRKIIKRRRSRGVSQCSPYNLNLNVPSLCRCIRFNYNQRELQKLIFTPFSWLRKTLYRPAGHTWAGSYEVSPLIQTHVLSHWSRVVLVALSKRRRRGSWCKVITLFFDRNRWNSNDYRPEVNVPQSLLPEVEGENGSRLFLKYCCCPLSLERSWGASEELLCLLEQNTACLQTKAAFFWVRLGAPPQLQLWGIHGIEAKIPIADPLRLAVTVTNC